MFFEIPDIDPALWYWLTAVVKLVAGFFNKGGDPDETEVEPNP